MDRILWARILVILGLFGMLVGALDPLEGSIIILPSSGLAAIGVGIGHTRRRKMVYIALALIVIGIAAMFLLSGVGGVGGPDGTSKWWALLVIPYPIGWFAGVAGAVMALVDLFKHPEHAAV